jgi:hypothetical protein
LALALGHFLKYFLVLHGVINGVLVRTGMVFLVVHIVVRARIFRIRRAV